MTEKEKRYLIAFGKNLKKLRETKGLSTRQFANAAEISHSSVTRFEAGQTNPSLTALIRIAHALEVKQSTLLMTKKSNPI